MKLEDVQQYVEFARMNVLLIRTNIPFGNSLLRLIRLPMLFRIFVVTLYMYAKCDKLLSMSSPMTSNINNDGYY